MINFNILIDESFSVLNTDTTLAPTNNKKILSLINDFEGGDWRYAKFQEFIWDNIVYSYVKKNIIKGKKYKRGGGKCKKLVFIRIHKKKQICLLKIY